jgi:hypothetical protein
VRIQTSPEFSSHRQDLAAADGAVPTQASAGINARDYEYAVISIDKTTGTITDLDVSVYFWDDVAGKFIVSKDADAVHTDITDSTQFTLKVLGRIFWVRVVSLTGTGPKIDINVAGWSVVSS